MFERTVRVVLDLVLVWKILGWDIVETVTNIILTDGRIIVKIVNRIDVYFQEEGTWDWDVEFSTLEFRLKTWNSINKLKLPELMCH